MASSSQDVANEIAGELQAKPDLIIGNYSDGNLVASLLAHKLGVTQVCCQLNSFIWHLDFPRPNKRVIRIRFMVVSNTSDVWLSHQLVQYL